MTTREEVSHKLLAYLNQELTLALLVDWAENSLATGGLEPEEDVELLADVLMYLAGADTRYFPLTWEMCQDFMKRLGSPVRVVMVGENG